MRHTLLELAAMAGGTLLPETQPGSELSRATADAVVTDSRQVGPGSLFVAIAGERTDGHAHLAAVADAGGAAAVVCDVAAARSALTEAGLGPEALPLIVVADTVDALGRLAAAHLADLREKAAASGQALTVVGMTGSVGKTTTKDLTRQLLAASAPTIAPVASFNNEIGLPLTVLQADLSTRFLVLEMGASAAGHISYLTGIAPLDAAAVLMVGHAHLGGFGSVEGVARAKSEILTGLLPTGTAVLNRDDPLTLEMAPLAPGNVLTFSASGDPQAEIRATGVELDDRARAALDLHLPGLPEPARLRLALPGEHNVSNALAAAGLALAAGVKPELIIEALASAALESPHRMDVRDLVLPARSGQDGERRIRLVDDSYNANIDSMTAALAALPALARARRPVVIISEMLELGAQAKADHQRTGELAVRAGARVLITIGSGAAPAAVAARQAAGAGGIEIIELADAEQAIGLIGSPQCPLNDDDAVLVKGSHGSGAWRVADHLIAAAVQEDRPPSGSPRAADPTGRAQGKEDQSR